MSSGNAELAYKPARELRDLIALKKLSPVELVEFTLDRIEALNERLGAYITVMGDQAMAEARAAEAAVSRGDNLGALHGIPVPIKDLEGVKGVRLTQGSLVDDAIADSDAMCVERVRAAGGIVIGKTNTPEHGHTPTTENRVFDPARNPWNTARTPGGSSGGAAVSVAAGITAIAQGSDGGGSIRIPGSLSGVYGIKATQGRIPRKHSSEQSFNVVNNSSVGPMTWDVQDAAILMNVLAGPAENAEYTTLPDEPPDFTVSLSRSMSDLRIGFDTSCMGGAKCDSEVFDAAAAAAKVFDELGANVEEVSYAPDPHEELAESFYDFFCIRGYARWSEQLDNPETAELLTDYFREDLEKGKSLGAIDYVNCTTKAGKYRAYADRFFADFDLLLTPSTATTAFEIGKLPQSIGGRTCTNLRFDFIPFAYMFNLTGNPAATVPCGFDSEGMPIGLQIVGDMKDEMLILMASVAYEKVRPWADKRPSL